MRCAADEFEVDVFGRELRLYVGEDVEALDTACRRRMTRPSSTDDLNEPQAGRPRRVPVNAVAGGAQQGSDGGGDDSDGASSVSSGYSLFQDDFHDTYRHEHAVLHGGAQGQLVGGDPGSGNGAIMKMHMRQYQALVVRLRLPHSVACPAPAAVQLLSARRLLVRQLLNRRERDTHHASAGQQHSLGLPRSHSVNEAAEPFADHDAEFEMRAPSQGADDFSSSGRRVSARWLAWLRICPRSDPNHPGNVRLAQALQMTNDQVTALVTGVPAGSLAATGSGEGATSQSVGQDDASSLQRGLFPAVFEYPPRALRAPHAFVAHRLRFLLLGPQAREVAALPPMTARTGVFAAAVANQRRVRAVVDEADNEDDAEATGTASSDDTDTGAGVDRQPAAPFDSDEQEDGDAAAAQDGPARARRHRASQPHRQQASSSESRDKSSSPLRVAKLADAARAPQLAAYLMHWPARPETFFQPVRWDASTALTQDVWTTCVHAHRLNVPMPGELAVADVLMSVFAFIPPTQRDMLSLIHVCWAWRHAAGRLPHWCLVPNLHHATAVGGGGGGGIGDDNMPVGAGGGNGGGPWPPRDRSGVICATTDGILGTSDDCDTSCYEEEAADCTQPAVDRATLRTDAAFAEELGGACVTSDRAITAVDYLAVMRARWQQRCGQVHCLDRLKQADAACGGMRPVVLDAIVAGILILVAVGGGILTGYSVADAQRSAVDGDFLQRLQQQPTRAASSNSTASDDDPFSMWIAPRAELAFGVLAVAGILCMLLVTIAALRVLRPLRVSLRIRNRVRSRRGVYAVLWCAWVMALTIPVPTAMFTARVFALSELHDRTWRLDASGGQHGDVDLVLPPLRIEIADLRSWKLEPWWPSLANESSTAQLAASRNCTTRGSAAVGSGHESAEGWLARFILCETCYEAEDTTDGGSRESVCTGALVLDNDASSASPANDTAREDRENSTTLHHEQAPLPSVLRLVALRSSSHQTNVTVVIGFARWSELRGIALSILEPAGVTVPDGITLKSLWPAPYADHLAPPRLTQAAGEGSSANYYTSRKASVEEQYALATEWWAARHGNHHHHVLVTAEGAGSRFRASMRVDRWAWLLGFAGVAAILIALAGWIVVAPRWLLPTRALAWPSFFFTPLYVVLAMSFASVVRCWAVNDNDGAGLTDIQGCLVDPSAAFLVVVVSLVVCLVAFVSHFMLVLAWNASALA